ncbi:MAG: helix-turn-helix domain-containing protein [Mycobacteriales bacterium]
MIEAGLIRERTLAALAASPLAGPGRRAAVGDDRGDAAAMLRQARRMHTEGVAPGEIAKVLGVGRATVYRHLDAGPRKDMPGRGPGA